MLRTALDRPDLSPGAVRVGGGGGWHDHPVTAAAGTAVSAEGLALLRPRLVAFCYQMLGSPFDAEDAVQDVMERAWRARETYDAARASLATWCYRIAHNVCVDRLRGAPRRPLPRDLQDPGIEIGAPLVPALDVPWLMPAPSAWTATSEVGAAVERSAEVRLAVTAMLQALPARQRGAFVLREVLGCSAAETATVLETSVPAVNSALQRAGRPWPRLPVRRLPMPPPGRSTPSAWNATPERSSGPTWRPWSPSWPTTSCWRCRRCGPGRWDDGSSASSWSTCSPGAAPGGRPVWSAPTASRRCCSTDSQPEGPTAHTLQLFDADAHGAIGHVLVYQDPRLFALFENRHVRGDESGGSGS